MCRTSFSILGIAILLWFAADSSAGTGYSVTDLGVPGASGINSAGQVAGSAPDSAKVQHPYLYDGTIHELPSLSGLTNSYATGVSDTGQVVGFADTPSPFSGPRPFIYRNGSTVDMGTPGDTGEATGMNGSGQATGWFVAFGQPYHFFMYDGSVHDLGTLPGNGSLATLAIGPTREIVGHDENTSFYYDGSIHILSGITPAAVNSHGVIVGIGSDGFAATYDGSLHSLGSVSGFNESEATAINSSGVIVGLLLHYPTFTGQEPFIYQNGTMTDLNDLLPPGSGWTLEGVSGINDAGQIVGYGIDPSGAVESYLLTPTGTPEPSAACLLAAGATGLLLRRRRKGLTSLNLGSL